MGKGRGDGGEVSAGQGIEDTGETPCPHSHPPAPTQVTNHETGVHGSHNEALCPEDLDEDSTVDMKVPRSP